MAGSTLYTIRDVLDRASRGASADRVAILESPRVITYAELLEQSLSFASVLKHAGVSKGDRVAIFLPRSINAVVALFATWYAGGVAVIINDRLRKRQAHHIVEHSGATAVVTDSRQLLSVPDFPNGHVINIDQVGSRAPCTPERLIGRDLALLIYTSGSTGFPKGVMISHDNLVAGATIVSDYLNLTSADVILSVLPFSFDYGLNQLLTALFVGGRLVIQRSLFPRDICETLQKEQITGLAGVPTLWLQLSERHSPFLKSSYPALRYTTNSGGHLPESTVRRMREAHPHVDIFLMYGLTEAFRSTCLPPHEVDRRPSSIGKAIPNCEILVINGRGELCRPGEIGELVHRGATVSMGYWRDPESTRRVIRPHPFEQDGNDVRERVVFSGDLVKTDADGFLYYVGRKEKLIKSRGVRVSPEEIESCVYSSALVSHAVSFAVPKGDVDSDIVIAVIPRDPSLFREEMLEAFCKIEMPEYMWPRVIWTMPTLPLTASGKPDRCRIEQMYVESCQGAGWAARAAGAP